MRAYARRTQARPNYVRTHKHKHGTKTWRLYIELTATGLYKNIVKISQFFAHGGGGGGADIHVHGALDKRPFLTGGNLTNFIIYIESGSRVI